MLTAPEIVKCVSGAHTLSPSDVEVAETKMGEATKVEVYVSQETPVTNSHAPSFAEADADTVVGEPMVRNGDAPFDPSALDIDYEKLGRKRPESLPTVLREVAFCFSILTSSVMAVSSFVSSPDSRSPALS